MGRRYWLDAWGRRHSPRGIYVTRRSFDSNSFFRRQRPLAEVRALLSVVLIDSDVARSLWWSKTRTEHRQDPW